MHSMREYNVCNDMKCTKIIFMPLNTHFQSYHHLDYGLLRYEGLTINVRDFGLTNTTVCKTGLCVSQWYHLTRYLRSRISILSNKNPPYEVFYAWKSHYGKSSHLNPEASKVFLSKSKAYKVFRPKIFFVCFHDYAHVHAPSHNLMQHHDYEC